MELVRIREAKPMGGQHAQLTLTDGRVVERDLGPLLIGPIFSEMPDVLIWGGPPPAVAASDVA